jgi:predicted enzyme related to lactoylglutathione lyase/uncharacterized protein YndB with AHSA1/START domain
MLLRHVEIFVSDPLKSKAFYEEVLGFTTTAVQSGKYVWMRLGDKQIMLRPGRGGVNGKAFDESQYNVVLCSDDAAAELERLQARGLEVRGDDQGCPTFADPDGNWFQLIGTDGSFPGPRGAPAPACPPDLSARPGIAVATRAMRAGPGALYRAWTEAFDVWFAVPGSVTMVAEIDRPYFFETLFDGQRHPHYGRFLRLERDREVAMTWVTGATGGAETVVTATLEALPHDGGTSLRVEHAGFADEAARERHAKAWPLVLAHMDERIG